jgi:hypothetical protein
MESTPGYRWYHKALALVMAVVIMEIGIFLMIYPWMEDYWPKSFFAYLDPAWDRIWQSPYFRGAITGLGIVNVYIAFTEVVRLRRFAQPRPIETSDEFSRE